MYNEDVNKWLAYWKERKLFLFDDKSEKPWFIIDTPPPFTDGALHMGHTFWVCTVDTIARQKRMKGFNVLYPQGWDIHGFPTERAVEKKFGKNLPRKEFYDRCMEVSKEAIDTMRGQMLALGASFDERLDYYTISDDYLAKVQLSVLMMHEKGMVYRAAHPVEWCVYCATAISREQSDEREEESFLNHLDFEVMEKGKKAGRETITIATSRPEMLHACVALAVNPKDKRYGKLIGRKARVPLYGGEVAVIGDDAVDKDYGTGAEMVCTFGDKRDIAIYYKHKLPMIEAMSENGLLKNAGKFTGTKLRDARAKVVEELRAQGILKKQEPIRHTVKVHDRCSNTVEFVTSMQWFMKTKENADKIKETANEITWVPESAKRRLLDWADFIEWDWVISRNRVFGTPIPFWHCEKCGGIVAADREKLPVDPATAAAPVKDCPKCHGKLMGETDTLDGWVDTSITPMIIGGWPHNGRLMKRAMPASMRIQGTDIVRTWAFYTIYRTLALTGGKPWESIVVHSMILGTDGREMHKSLGNGILPSELMSKYPIDAIRLWVSLSGGITKDKPFSYQDMDYAKSFITKLYNTANFVKLANGKGKLVKEEPHKDLNMFDMWVLNRLNEVVKATSGAYDRFMLHEALSAALNFYWHEFADYYIEEVKHRVYSEDTGVKARRSREAAIFTLNHVLNAMLRLFAPAVPFVCEEINAMFDSEKSIFEQGFPAYAESGEPSSYVINGFVFKSAVLDIDYVNAGAFVNGIIGEIRKQKAQGGIALNRELATININVPEEYYNAALVARPDIAGICKASKVNIKKGKFSVEIAVPERQAGKEPDTDAP
jgi:valyl-tRNA synthetase